MQAQTSASTLPRESPGALEAIGASPIEAAGVIFAPEHDHPGGADPGFAECGTCLSGRTGLQPAPSWGPGLGFGRGYHGMGFYLLAGVFGSRSGQMTAERGR